MIPSLQFVGNGGSATASTSYVDIPNLSFFVSAGGTYRFEVYYYYRAVTGGTSRFQPTMNGTCTATSIVHHWCYQVNANSASNSQAQSDLGLPTAAFAGTVAAATGVDYAVFGTGLIVVGTAGTLTAAAASSGANSTVQAGGRFLLHQLA